MVVDQVDGLLAERAAVRGEDLHGVAAQDEGFLLARGRHADLRPVLIRRDDGVAETARPDGLKVVLRFAVGAEHAG